jgi:DNA mismatch repair protein MutL
MPISLLPTDVIDQIAAGEVVERPAHLVKELVENSLDAKAKKIIVEFSDGGRSIRVTDDGQGIEKDEIKAALERFATSKISKADDLWKLRTYGFRGEALASISAVSKLTLISRKPSAENASRVVSDFGKKNGPDEVGGQPGTKITVENLFENVPARLKFMRSASAEHTQIKQTLKALALCHPSVEFQIFEEGEVVDIWPVAKTPLERAQQVLGVEKLYFHEKEREGVSVKTVYASPHDVARSSRNIWLFVQDRWVQDRTIQAAVMEAYRNLLMHGEYPIAAVWLTVPTDQIDVNIHPTKSQVKFMDTQSVFRAVQSTLREGLESAPWLAGGMSTSQKEIVKAKTGMLENLQFQGRDFDQVQYSKKSLDLNYLPSVSSGTETYSDIYESKPAATAMAVSYEEPAEKKGGVWSRLEVLAQAHLTYLVCQSEDKMVFVDQHAAHERVMFERLMKSWQTGGLEVQDFLFPLALDLTAPQIEALMAHEQDLQKVGIHIETLGPQTLGVKSAPAIVKEVALHEALQKMADDLTEKGGSFALEKMMADLCARLACHSAVRAGQALSIEQMKSLLEEMDDFPLSSFCPHGRPVSVEYPFYELEKDFGRIV